MVLEISQYFPVKVAISRALAALRQPEAETVPTRKAFGRVAAETRFSGMDTPSFSTSHMDGFAIRAKDSVGASEERPKRLVLVGAVPLGSKPALRLRTNEAARVSTGSFLPTGADSVVQAEEVRKVGGKLIVKHEVQAGSFVFKAGEDVRKGRVVVKAGEVIRAQDVGMLVGVAIGRVKVWRRPRVAVLATGSELTNSMAVTGIRTRNSHAPVFLSLADALGCEAVDLGIAPDKVSAIRRKIVKGLKQADILLMTGGTSVGRADLSDRVVSKLRPRVLCHGIRMDRGRVSGVAVVNGKGIVMMPGPIQGAMNAFVLLGFPMIGKLSGRKEFKMTTSAKLTRRWKARRKFPNFTKVVYLRVFQSRNGVAAEPLAGETESMSLLTGSNAYAVIPESVTALKAGSEIEAHLLPGFSFA